jgi:signal transduction histidine kinase
MEALARRRVPIVAADVLILLLCLLHVPALLSRARAPFLVDTYEGSARIFRVLDPAAGHVEPAMGLVSLGGTTIERPALVEYVADRHRIGDSLPAVVQRGGVRFEIPVTLVRYYRPVEVVVFYVIGIATWLVALFVLLNGPPGATTAILHAAMISMAAVVMLAWEGFTPGAVLPWTLTSLLFFGSYALVAAHFFQFTRRFPSMLAPRRDTLSAGVYVIAGGAVASAASTYWQAILRVSPDAFLTYSAWFDVFHVVILLIILAGIGNFIVQFRRAGKGIERRKLQWLLFGLLLGPTPFLILTVLPSMAAPALALPEAVTLVTLVVIPVSFAVSFIRYHILDISLVLNRTTVYVLAVGLVLLVYAGLVAGVSSAVGSYVPWAAAAAAVLVALLFEPARERVQRFVDRRFFSVEYDFRKAERAFVERIKNSLTEKLLADVLVRETEALIPVKRIGFFTMDRQSRRLRCTAHREFDLLERRGITFEPDKLRTPLTMPVALKERVEPGVRFEPADSTVFRRWGMEIVFPIRSDTGEFLGFLVLGGKRSDARFTVEDVDLFTNICTTVGLEMQRISLQRDLARKESEARQLKELNELKSEFVSYVSHEFRNPLTSIKIFAELLQSRKRNLAARRREFGERIQGEAERLERMVSTVLDSAKIESGVQMYTPELMDLRAAVRQALADMNYQLKDKEFTVVARLGRGSALIDADGEAVGQAVRNLLSNAIKYCGTRRHITVSLLREGGWYVCEVKDRGLGISADALPHLFEKFYREQPAGGRIQGIGLGLPLVRHIMESHGGRVEVASEKGAGSTFRLVFPARHNGA